MKKTDPTLDERIPRLSPVATGSARDTMFTAAAMSTTEVARGDRVTVGEGSA
jgi:hypothetical protein